MNRNDRPREQWERRMANKDGINYAEVRACYGRRMNGIVKNIMEGSPTDEVA